MIYKTFMICLYPNQQPQVTAVSLALQIFKQSIIDCLNIKKAHKCQQQQQKYQNYVFYIHTKILEYNLFAFAYRLFHEDFSPIDRLES